MSVQRRSELEREDLPEIVQQCETLVPHAADERQRPSWVEDGKPVFIVPENDTFGREEEDSKVWIEATDDDLVQLEENR